jgi:prepilin-type N-terminal cleavage/methylation domain-containing protein
MRQVLLAHKMPQHSLPLPLPLSHSLPLSQSSPPSVVNLPPLPATARRGFTLLELLVAGALIAVAATVVAGAFAAGFRVWQRASQQGGGYEDAVIALELIQKDIRNTEPFRLIPFKGSESGLELPSVVSNQPGSIQYEFSAASRQLMRVTRIFLIPEGEKEVREVIMDKVESVRFSYGDRGPDGKGALNWAGAWPPGTNTPAAVKVQLRSPPLIDLERTVVLP